MSNGNFAFGGVEVCVDFSAITGIFEQAHAEGRETLFEYEVYNLYAIPERKRRPKLSFYRVVPARPTMS